MLIRLVETREYRQHGINSDVGNDQHKNDDLENGLVNTYLPVSTEKSKQHRIHEEKEVTKQGIRAKNQHVFPDVSPALETEAESAHTADPRGNPETDDQTDDACSDEGRGDDRERCMNSTQDDNNHQKGEIIAERNLGFMVKLLESLEQGEEKVIHRREQHVKTENLSQNRSRG